MFWPCVVLHGLNEVPGELMKLMASEYSVS